MATLDEAPIFNLKAVVQETGLKPDTLRAWERRYGIPDPNRTSGGHRLYSQRDIETLKWMIARQNEGLSISRAVSLWETLLETGQDPLDMPQYAAASSSHGMRVEPGESISEHRAAWVQTCLAFDSQQAEALLAQAFALYPLEAVCFEVLQKGLSEIGAGWYSGEVTVQQEHFASAMATRRLETLLAATPPPTRGGRILIGCAPDDDHTFSALLLSLLLRRMGLDVVYLGANTPNEQLEETVETIHPDLVVMVAQHLSSAAALLEVAEALRGVPVPLAFGGRVFEQIAGLQDHIPGYHLGPRLEDAPAIIEGLLGNRAVPAAPLVASAAYKATLQHFEARHLMLEARVSEMLSTSAIEQAHMDVALQNFSSSIASGLKLGSLDLIEMDLDWLHGLLSNLHLPERFLHVYLEAYRVAAHAVLDERGQILLHWLDKIGLEYT